MPAKKKTVTEITEVTNVTEEKAEEITMDYKVVSESEVISYLEQGYYPVGGAVLKFGCWYQAVLRK